MDFGRCPQVEFRTFRAGGGAERDAGQSEEVWDRVFW